MTDTIFLAKIIGVFALLEGFSMILRRQVLLAVFHEVGHSRALSYIIGMVMIILGLLIAMRHTNFSSALATIITLAGWLVLAEGVAYIFLSSTMVEQIMRSLDSPFIYYAIGAGYLILGAYLLTAVF